MKKGFRRGLSVLVVVLMLISMMQIGVMAEEATAVNGALVNQSDENVDSQGGSALTPMPNSLTMPSANDPMVNGLESIPGEPATAASGSDPTPQTVPQNLETTEAIQSSAIEGDFRYEAVTGGISITKYTGPGGNVVIPGTLGGKKVVAIGNDAFYRCSSLTTVSIPDGVTSIGQSAFYECSSLTNVTIPDSVTSIEFAAFSRCSSLTSINVNSANLNYSSLDGVLFDKAITTLIACPGAKVSITIPNSVTSIGDVAFLGCASLTNITIPDSVTTIGDTAFADCISLTNITIPDSVTTIGSSAFADCISLTNITIPDGVTSIGSWAFDGCSSLTTVTIPNGVTSIGSWAFSGCSGLTNITIPDSVTSIGDWAFQRCSSLTNIHVNSNNLNYSSLDGVLFDKAVTTLITCPGGKVSITIPDSVTSIGGAAFEGCSSLTNINVNSNNLNYSSLDGVLFDKAVTTLIACPGAKVSITIPNSVTSIGWSAFSGCSSLTNVTIPDSVTSIGYGAFQGCDSLTSIQINSANTTIIDSYYEWPPDGLTIPVSTTIIGHNPSTAKDFALKYNRTFIEIGADKTLKEIAITSPAQKLVYKVGETLDLTGLVVTGTYSDGTSKVETLTSDNVTGFNSSATAANQLLTITIGGKTATYTVKIVAGEEPEKGEFTGFLGQDSAGNYYLYNKADFNNSYLAYQINPSLSGAKMYRHYMNQPCRIVALKDLTRGYMDYSATASASLSAQLRGETFDIDAYFGRSDAKIYEKAVTVVGIVDKDGNVTY